MHYSFTNNIKQYTPFHIHNYAKDNYCSFPVPPAILIKPNEYIHLLGNRPVRFPINFQSRFQSETVIVWYKNQNSAVHKEYIRTEYTDEPNATTELNFANLRRSDAGLYTVVIQNTFSELSPDLRKVQTSFRLDVTGQLCKH